uniref:Uncharacterized protein n=1 Tax=Podoviridae sp. ctZkC8 TaxID=2825259 RepID=A0A8S5UCG2_9CAUD|nr:MAG TPA: hypothetical protein [Podoviridae sp. ctZkC8]
MLCLYPYYLLNTNSEFQSIPLLLTMKMKAVWFQESTKTPETFLLISSYRQ